MPGPTVIGSWRRPIVVARLGIIGCVVARVRVVLGVGAGRIADRE
jgi:hypothetical protein